jgi:hypothetical protein
VTVDRVQLGWRVPTDAWEQFEEQITDKWGVQGGYLRFELERAMREFLDEDGLLATVEDLLKEYTDLQGLSSSTAVVATERYRGADTRKVSHRVNADLKAKFKQFADEHGASSYGRLLAAALDSYSDGGRARRILDDVRRLVTGGTDSGTTAESVENDGSDPTESGADEAGVENQLSTLDDCGTTAVPPDPSPEEPRSAEDVDVEARLVVGIAEELSSHLSFPKRLLESTIGEVVGESSRAVIEAYREPVLDQLSAAEHPHNESLYVTEEFRENNVLWADLDRAERIVLLRRFAAAEAARAGSRRETFTYREVQDLFEEYAGGGSPSHQYAYDLMELAEEVAGFAYGEYHGQYQLRVDLAAVDGSVIEYVLEETSVRLEDLSLDLDVTSYTAGSAPDQEGSADD